ncbi:MAG TPA: hypothetical protein VLD67_11955 [Vicinamibacterales bacterium]|nr:hypothetical protein [Vicinamibacterales bacterium]
MAVALTAFLVAGGATAAYGDEPLGDWNLKVDWPNRTADVVLTVSRSDKGLVATWTGPQGRLTADAVTFSDQVLRFTLGVEDQNGDPVKLQFEGRIKDGRIDGQLVTPRGAKIKVTGRRVAARG